MSSNFTFPRRTGHWLFTSVSFTLSLLILVSYWAMYIRRLYYPSGDEIALLVHSSRFFHPSALEWITQGFSHYFLSYPQWAPSSTDFLRPGANITYYFDSLIFGPRWSYYLLTSYFIQSALIGGIVYIGAVKLRLRGVLVAAIGILCFLSPAFSSQELFFPSFSFDLLGALMVLLGVTQFLSSRWIYAMVFFFMAIFTKETMFFAPIAGALWTLKDRSQGPMARRLVVTVVLLLPVLAWEAVRLHAFHGHSGVYILQAAGWKPYAVRALHGVLAWPFGVRSDTQVFNARYPFFILNGFFWVAVIVNILNTWLRTSRGMSRQNATHGLLWHCGIKGREGAIILTFCVMSLIMPISLSLPQRFGAASYPFLYMVLALVASSATTPFFRIFATTSLFILPIVAVYQKIVDPLPISLMQKQWILAESYINEIHRSTASAIFLLNDTSGGFTTPVDVARFATYKGALIRIDNVDLASFPVCSVETFATTKSKNERGFVLASTIPQACGSFMFDGVPPDFITASQGSLARVTSHGILRYKIPQYVPLSQSRKPAIFGELQVELDDPPAHSSLLVPELQKLRYREFSLAKP